MKRIGLFGLIVLPFYETPGTGSGGGSAGAGAGGVAGASGGAAPAGAGAGGAAPAGAAGAAGGTAPIRLSDDTMVIGADGKPVRYRDHVSSTYMPRADFERGRQFLLGEAQKLEQAWQKFNAGQGPKPREQRPTQAELIEEVEGMSVVDGKTLARLHREGYSPIAQQLVRQQQIIQQMQTQLQNITQRTGTLDDDYQNTQFESHITKHLSAIPEIAGLHGMVDPKDPFVRELAKDVWLSHDQSTWKDADFQEAVRTRIEAAVKMVRAMDQGYVARQREEKRQRFANPRLGAATPSGQTPYKHQNGTSLAKELFGSLNNPQ